MDIDHDAAFREAAIKQGLAAYDLKDLGTAQAHGFQLHRVVLYCRPEPAKVKELLELAGEHTGGRCWGDYFDIGCMDADSEELQQFQAGTIQVLNWNQIASNNTTAGKLVGFFDWLDNEEAAELKRTGLTNFGLKYKSA